MADTFVTLLLVEDETVIAEFAQSALEEGGYAVVLASTGSEAVRLLKTRGEELAGLVTDVRLPDGPDGWELARLARELKANIAVVYMSGDSAADWTAQGVPKSVMLQKPFASAQLVTAISTLLIDADTDPT